MTFAVATMVALSHAGESEKLRQPLFILWLVAFGVLSALCFRITAVLIPSLYFQLLGLAAVFWILISASWLCFIAPRILRVPHPGTFENEHEQMKKRVANLAR